MIMFSKKTHPIQFVFNLQKQDSLKKSLPAHKKEKKEMDVACKRKLLSKH